MTTPEPQKNFSILEQYVKDLSVENFLTPQEMINRELTPNGEINLDMTSEEISDTMHQVQMNITVTARDNEADKTLYMVQVEYIAIVHIEGFKEEIPALVGVEAPRIIFPFVRQIIASATVQAGFPTLMLNPIDFLSLFLEQQRQQSAQQTTQ